MSFNIGEKVIHSTHGFAEIVDIEEKVVAGISLDYYVVQTSTLKLWIPVLEDSKGNLRSPTPKEQFNPLFEILRSRHAPFSDFRNERRLQIHERITRGTTDTTCSLIRDLSYCRKSKKLNEYESSIFKRAVNMLIDEWQYAMSITKMQATTELNTLLDESYSLSLAV